MGFLNKNNGDLVARTNYPLYAVKMLGDRYFVVAGGGGASKTGIASGFIIYQLSFTHDSTKSTVTEIGKYNSGSVAITNIATYQNVNGQKYLVAGQDAHTQLYYIFQNCELSGSNTDWNDNEETLCTRKPTDPNREETSRIVSAQNSLLNLQQLKMFAYPKDAVLTDMGKEQDAHQKVVKIGLTGKIMATGGTDGFIRLWRFPAMKPLQEIRAHSEGVIDLDFSPDSLKIVSISYDGSAVVWNVEDGKKVHQLERTALKNIKYYFNRCRFAPEEHQSQLFTAVYSASQSKPSAFLQRWNTSPFFLAKSVPVSFPISALAVSPCGKFVAVGSPSGSVDIYVPFSLKRIKHVECAHTASVTGLEFLPCNSEINEMHQSEGIVISTSVDKDIRVHHVPFHKKTPAWIAILINVALLALTIMLCNYLGLQVFELL